MTGQFLSIDPDLATTNQPYEYGGDDPVNEVDPNGKYDYSWNFTIGRTVNVGMASDVFWSFSHHLYWYFPFNTGACNVARLGEVCNFWPTGFGGANGPLDTLQVADMTSTSFTLRVLHWKIGPYDIDPPGSTVRFMIFNWFDGNAYLNVTGHANPTFFNSLSPVIPFIRGTWSQMQWSLQYISIFLGPNKWRSV